MYLIKIISGWFTELVIEIGGLIVRVQRPNTSLAHVASWTSWPGWAGRNSVLVVDNSMCSQNHAEMFLHRASMNILSIHVERTKRKEGRFVPILTPFVMFSIFSESKDFMHASKSQIMPVYMIPTDPVMQDSDM